MNRRSFVSGMSLAGLGLLASGNLLAAEETNSRELSVFSRFFEHLPYDELASTLAPLEIAGLEAPLRSGGHIEPEELAEKLPAFVQALAKKDLKVTIMASSINSVDAKGLSEKQLRAAAAAGVTRYRLQYLYYDLSKPIKPQMQNFKAQLTDLAALNKELGMQGLYQNHRGTNLVGGPVWDIVELLEDIDPKHIGLAFDFAHATVEGANTWELNFRRALPHIRAVFFKDYKPVGRNWHACPLGEGSVSPSAGSLVTKLLPADCPVSLHIEYIDNGENRVERIVKAMHNDLATLRKWLG